MKITLTLIGLFLYSSLLIAQDYSEAKARYEKAKANYSNNASNLKSSEFSPDIFAFATFEVHQVQGKVHRLGDNLMRIDLEAYESGAGWTGGKYFYFIRNELVAVQLYFIERKDGATVETPSHLFFYHKGKFTAALNAQDEPVPFAEVERQNNENLSDWMSIQEALR